MKLTWFETRVLWCLCTIIGVMILGDHPDRIVVKFREIEAIVKDNM